MLAKRAFDVMLSGVGLSRRLRCGRVIAILIKLEDGGPVFYGQERSGLQRRARSRSASSAR